MLADLRQALRQLRRRKGVTAAAALTLALGLGAVTTVATLIRGILLAPLAYAEPDGLLRLHTTMERLRGSPNARLAAMWNRVPVSYQRTVDRRRASRTLAGIGLYEPYRAVLEEGNEPREVPAARVDPELLEVLGVAAERGRLFTRAEGARDPRRALLSHGLWRSAFGGDPEVLGRGVRLDGEVYTVVGVMPPVFSLPGGDERLWTLLAPGERDLASREEQRYAAIARLAPGVTVEAARRELDRLSADLARGHPETDPGVGARLVPLREAVVGEAGRLLGLLAVAAGAVLLLAALNVAHLLLVQSVERRRELALRLALGAGRRRLLRALAAEILLLVSGAAAGGLLISAVLLQALPRFLAAELPRLETVALDGAGVFAAALAAAGTAGLLALLPALRVSEAGLAGPMALRAGGGLPGGGRADRAGHGGLVVTEVALSLVLASSALLLALDWLRLADAPRGFSPRGVLVQEIRLPDWRYPDGVARGEFVDRLLAELEALPGVRSAALTSRLPLPGPSEVWGFRIAGVDPPGGDWTQGRSATMLFVGGDYLRTLGIPLLDGRGFTAEDRAGPTHQAAGRRVVLVDRRLADQHWPDGGAVGTRVVMGDDPAPYTVVGVVGEVRIPGPTEEPAAPMLQPWDQRPAARLAALVRVEGGRPGDLAGAVRRTVRALDPALALEPAAALDDLLDRSLAGPRSRAVLVALSAGVALLLTLIGTFGVTSYGVARRRREIGVRLALGAGRRQIHRLVLGRVGALALIGLALGGTATLAAGRLLSGLLHGVSPGHPPTLAAVAAALLVTCLAAAWLPARRAGRIDPAATIAGE